MTAALRALAALLVALGCCGARAEVDAATAQALMRDSGLWQMLGTVPSQMLAGIDQSASRPGARVTAGELQRLRDAVTASYAPERLRHEATGVCARGLEPAVVEPLRNWFGSGLGARFARLENEAGQQPSDAQAVSGMTVLEQATPARRSLLRRLALASRAVEINVEIVIGTALAMQRGLAQGAAPGEPRPSDSELRVAIEAQREQLTREVGAVVIAAMAHTYRGVADGEIEAYIDFLNSPAGARFTAVAGAAIDTAMAAAGAEFGRRLRATRDSANS